MSPRSVSNSGSITPPRPSRRPVASCSPSPAREEPVPEAQPEQEPKIFVVNLIDEVLQTLLRSLKITSDPSLKAAEKSLTFTSRRMTEDPLHS